jgi:serine/threonine protein kinase
MGANTTPPSNLIFGKYEIMERLAVGGMGEVFFAAQRGSVKGFERPVILKSLLPDLAEQADFIEQFLDEARVAATLNHPNVVSIHEVGMWNGVYFIAMEFIRGRNISQVLRLSLKKRVEIPWVVIARIIQDAASGLDHAHTAKDSSGNPLGIVHRDISPQNIMVREDGVTKVVDFGIARASNRAASRTATGAVKGKLAYMSPEQVRSKPLTAKADQFSLGIVLWELCTRRRLFQADKDFDLAMLVMDAPISSLKTLVPSIPEELDDIVMRMLQRDPDKRYASCSEVARDLEAFRMRFSPATSESPVALLMQKLGVEDLAALTPGITPSNKNFFINLKSGDIIDPTLGSPTTPQRPSSLNGLLKPTRGLQPKHWLLVSMAMLAVTALVVFTLRLRREQVVTVQPGLPIMDVAPDPSKVPTPEPPKAARLNVRTLPIGASISINGEPKGVSPVVWSGAAGKIVVDIEHPGYEPLKREMTLEAGEQQSYELTLVKKTVARGPSSSTGKSPVKIPTGPNVEAAAEVGPGFLTVATVPDTKLYVDGEYMGLTPLAKLKFKAGSHTVVMKNDEEGINVTRTVVLKPGEVFKISDRLK